MCIPVNGLDTYLIYTVLCFGFLLVPSSRYFECLNILSEIACTIFLCYVTMQIFTSNIEIDNQSLIVGDWTDVFQFFGILLFAYVPVVQVCIIHFSVYYISVYNKSNQIILQVFEIRKFSEIVVSTKI